MKISMVQNNYTIADFNGNCEKIIHSINKNSASDLIVFSELTLSGYYPWDLIYRNNFFEEQNKSLEKILDFSKTIKSHIVLGLVRNNDGKGKPFFNSLVVIHKGEIIFDYDKKLLPTYNIFDEARHFEPGTKNGFFELTINNIKYPVGFFICEDGWNNNLEDYKVDPIKEVIEAGAKILIGINASPSNLGKAEQRETIFSNIAKKYSTPIIYVNQVGGNDDIVFDGGSFVFNQDGEKELQLHFFEEDDGIYNAHANNRFYKLPEKNEFIFKQIGLGLKDYLSKLGFSKVIVGSSGGIDSALTLALAKLHLGSENVEAITMPSSFSSVGSVNDSIDLCNRLGIKLHTLPIKNEVNTIHSNFNKNMNLSLSGLSAENLQARIRGTLLMSYSNQSGALLLTTGNKSEISVGYFTLYGDSNGGLNLIGDLYKTEVYELSRWINSTYGELIPNIIISKEPSAELSPEQKDSDSLPEYEYLDALLKRELEWEFLNNSEKSIISNKIEKMDKNQINKVLSLIDKSEFKRKQAAPIIRIHPRAFGFGRKIPIVQKIPNY